MSCFLDKTSEMVIASLQELVSHLDSSVTRITVEKNTMHTILSACNRGIPETEQNKVRELLGVSKKRLYDHPPYLTRRGANTSRERRGRHLALQQISADHTGNSPIQKKHPILIKIAGE